MNTACTRIAAVLPIALLAAPADFTPASAQDLFPLEKGRLAIERSYEGWRHVEALGMRSGIWGSGRSGFEAWAYPFKLFDGLTVLISADGGKTFRGQDALGRWQVAAPHMAQMRLVDDRYTVTDTLFAPRKLPGVLFALDVDALVELEIAVRFKPSLAPMHMSASGPLQASWNKKRHELTVRDPVRQAELRLATSMPATRATLPGGRQEIRLHMPAAPGGTTRVILAAAGSWPSGPPAAESVGELLGSFPELFTESLEHSLELLARTPCVEAPDPEVAPALDWSAVSLDQLRVENPFLGPGLVSGYSSSGAGTVPRYAWFFDEPTLGSWALCRANLSGHAKEAFRFLMRYQREDGKTVHEVPQGLRYRPDFFKTSRYAYIHTDGPVYFLAAYGHYYRCTGDLEFVRELWPRMRKALQWCFSVMDPDDALLRIEPSDWGSAESSFSVWKDTQLEAMWTRALREMAWLAGKLADEDLSRRCARLAEKARASIEAKLWSPEAGNYLWGIDREGRPLRSLVPHHTLGFWLGSFRPDRIEKALENFNSADFLTDWGVRSLSLADPNYSASAYQTGTVWPVWNAGLIVSQYRHHRGVEAFRTWLAMVRLRRLDGLGPMPEVLHGHYYKRLATGVPHQLFSEVALQNGFYDGLLGLEVNVPDARFRLAPTLPPCWKHLKARNLPLGPGGWLCASLHLEATPRGSRLEIDIDLTFPRRPVHFTLAPVLPPGSTVRRVTVEGKEHPFRIAASPADTQVTIELETWRSECPVSIEFTGGVAYLPVDEPPRPGATSRNLRVIRAGLHGETWRMTVEGLPGTSYAVDLFTRRRPAGMDAPELEGTPGGYRLLLKAPDGAAPGRSGFVRWDVSVQMEAAAGRLLPPNEN